MYIKRKHLDNKYEGISDIDYNLETIIVEIDDSKFFHRKYCRGYIEEALVVLKGRTVSAFC